MTIPADPSAEQGNKVERTELDGYTLDQLSDYLDVGMTPADPVIDASPACQIALTSLRRVRAASAALLEGDAQRHLPADDRWIDRIMSAITLDAHAGRSIPIAHPSSLARITTTEGAVRGLVRAAGDTVSGLIVGRCHLDGDVTVSGAPIRIRVDASVFWGQPIKVIAQRLQSAVAAAILAQTDLNVTEIDVTVHDIFVPPQDPELERGRP